MRSVVLALLFIAPLTAAFAQSLPEGSHAHRHASAASPLTAPGNGAFAAIQEVVQRLLADPDTDWGRVNLEALRQHLADMYHFTLNVHVMEQRPIEGGVEFIVRPTTPDAAGSLERLFSAHPAILKQESGWDMRSTKNRDGSHTAQVTSGHADDVAKIRGLGYIGLIAYGEHHQAHHWQMATGVDPHHGH